MSINFMPSKDFEETRIMHTKNHNIEIMMGNKTNKISKEFFLISFGKLLKIFRRISETKRICF